MLRLIILTISVMLTMASNADAYIDPGTGSFILQAILAALLAVGASIRIYWYRIKKIWQKVFHRQEKPHQENQ